MREDYKKQLSGQIEKHFLNLEQMILEDIVRRIKKAGKITSTADWQINRLRIIGYSSEDIEKMIKETLNLSYPEVFELYDKVIDWEYVRNKDIYEQVNAKYIPYEENKELQQLTEGLIQQSNEELRNITQSMGFYVDYGNGKLVMTPLADIYQNYLDQAIAGVIYGTFDYNTMIRKAVAQLTNSGLRYIDYASGWHNRMDVAARRAIMTGVSQLTGKISDMNAEKLGTEHFEVAWHSGARPTHAVWQGKVWSKEQLVTVCGLGTGPGLLGWNCYHEYYPFVKGISERNWTDEWLTEQNRKENTPKTFNDKEYTLYEAKQQQRKMETAMRAQREKVVLLKQGGADPDDVMIARAKYQGQLNEYARFCKKMGLTEERERIYYDMRGRIATNTKDQNRKYTTDMIRNADIDSKQYYRYKNIIGADIGSLEKFRQMKYNELEKFSFIKLDYERRTELLKNPDKKLPNAENAILPEGKFTKYLFDKNSEKGYPKGKAFEARLGYNIDNWEELQKALKQRATKYPATFKGNQGFGDKYEQKMILYGLKGTPANVVVAWIVKPGDILSLTSAYIKEV